MGDVATLASGAKAGGGLLGAIGAYKEAASAKQQAEANAYIGRTRAMQTDTQSREALVRSLGSIRAGLASAGQGMNLGSAVLLDSTRKTSSQQRAIEYGNAQTASLMYKQQAANIHPGLAFLSGALGAAPSMFDAYQGMTR